MTTPYTKWQKEMDAARNQWEREPSDVELCNKYWNSLAGPENYNIQSGIHALEIFRVAAIKSVSGAVALASAFQEMARESGEFPRAELFEKDEELFRALKNAVKEQGQNFEVLNWLASELAL